MESRDEILRDLVLDESQAVASKYLNKPRGRFYCTFIDFAKAFDSVEHVKLWDALIRKGIGWEFSTCYEIYTQTLSHA